MKNDIKNYIKQRGYSYQKVAELFGFSIPTLDKFIKKHPNTIYYAVRGLPEVSHIKSERLATIRP
jgi:transcriptional regulator with XRE-family HTH domain